MVVILKTKNGQILTKLIYKRNLTKNFIFIEIKHQSMDKKPENTEMEIKPENEISENLAIVSCEYDNWHSE